MYYYLNTNKKCIFEGVSLLPTSHNNGCLVLVLHWDSLFYLSLDLLVFSSSYSSGVCPHLFFSFFLESFSAEIKRWWFSSHIAMGCVLSGLWQNFALVNNQVTQTERLPGCLLKQSVKIWQHKVPMLLCNILYCIFYFWLLNAIRQCYRHKC